MVQPNRDGKAVILSGTGDILGAIHLLSILLDVEGFKRWLASYRGLDTTAHVFNGYMFGLRTLVRLLHQAIDFDFSLDLSEDFILSRARFYGVPIAEVPNSCEKAILLRNIHRASRPLLGAKSWVLLESHAKAFSDTILAPLRRLSSSSKLTLPEATPDCETAANFVGQWQVHQFLNDTRRGYPHGYDQPMLHDKLTKERLAKVFEGYKLAIQYLWFRLLGDEFARSVAADIHKATNWREFDEYYRPIQYELVDPKENLTGLRGGFNTLLVAEARAKGVISEILEPKAKEQPLSPQKELHRKFLWHDIELVDASSTIFSGVLTFISLLNGAVVFRQRVGNSDPLLVMRVKHPVGGPDRHDYSYGILLEARGSFGISDYSGWLLFYDCCGDYSGFAGSQYAMAEQEIQEHVDQKAIEVHEVTIPKDNLLNLMRGKLLSATKDVVLAAEQTRSDLRSAENKLGAARGLLLELLGMRHYHTASTGTVRIEWAYERLGQEIDLLVRDGESLIFVECKKPKTDNPVEQMNRLKKKAAVLLSSSEFHTEWSTTSDTEVRYSFATWVRPLPAVFKKLRESGVEILVLSSEKAGIGRTARDRLKTALDAEKYKPRPTRDEFSGEISL
jgi:Holliday junction resolvase-like predicted endonuclease